LGWGAGWGGVGGGWGREWVESDAIRRRFLANPPRSGGGWPKRRTGGGHGLTARLAGDSKFLSPRRVDSDNIIIMILYAYGDSVRMQGNVTDGKRGEIAIKIK